MHLRQRTAVVGVLFAAAVLFVAACANAYRDDPRRALADAVSDQLSAGAPTITLAAEGDLDLAADPGVLEHEAARMERLITSTAVHLAGSPSAGEGSARDVVTQSTGELEVQFDDDVVAAARSVDGVLYGRADVSLLLDALGLDAPEEGLAGDAEDAMEDLELLLGAEFADALVEGSWLRLAEIGDLLDEAPLSDDGSDPAEEALERLRDFYLDEATVEHVDSGRGEHRVRVGATVGDLARLLDDLAGELGSRDGIAGGREQVEGHVPAGVEPIELHATAVITDDAVSALEVPLGAQIAELLAHRDDPTSEDDLERVEATGLDTLVLHVHLGDPPEPITAPADSVALDVDRFLEDLDSELAQVGDAVAADRGRPPEASPEENRADPSDDVAAAALQEALSFAVIDAELEDRPIHDVVLWETLVDELKDFDQGSLRPLVEDDRVVRVEYRLRESAACLELDADDPKSSPTEPGACP